MKRLMASELDIQEKALNIVNQIEEYLFDSPIKDILIDEGTRMGYNDDKTEFTIHANYSFDVGGKFIVEINDPTKRFIKGLNTDNVVAEVLYGGTSDSLVIKVTVSK